MRFLGCDRNGTLSERDQRGDGSVGCGAVADALRGGEQHGRSVRRAAVPHLEAPEAQPAWR